MTQGIEKLPQRRREGALRIGAALAVGCALAALAPASAAFAQTPPAVARPVVQALPTENSRRLNAALTRLGRNPRDVAALVDAGDAARGMGDFEAAIGFYRRADQISAYNPKVKSGLARALVANGKPVEALAEFQASELAGVSPREIAADRGLAYDLVGDNARAQQYYAQVLNGPDGDDVRQRLALSQAISGDEKAAEATLVPLLRKQDKPAWRAKAFALAISGDTRQAVEVATSILPRDLAQGVAPYLRYMPRLTRAQQAAAANLGIFPRASEIGRDDPAITAYARSRPNAAQTADAALVPRGKPLGNTTKSSRRAAEEAARVAPPELHPTIEKTEGTTAEDAAGAKSVKTPTPTPKPAPAPNPAPASAAVAPAPSASTSAAVAAARAPEPVRAPTTSFDLGQMASSRDVQAAQAEPEKPAVSPTPAQASTPPEAAQAAQAGNEVSSMSLSEAFADLGAPTSQVVPTAGAVDISKIEPAKPAPKPAPAADPEAAKSAKPTEAAKAESPKSPETKKTAKPAAKPVPPPHPSRIWAQIGVGRNKSAIAFDWRRWSKQEAVLFKGHTPYVSDKGGTNRILVGPFETQDEARKFAADIKKAGISNAFVWTSAAGEVVDELPLK